MPFQSDPDRIVWRVRIAAPPERVWEAIATDRGRARFWAESSRDRDGAIRLRFPDGSETTARILRIDPPRLVSIDYFGSPTSFELTPGDERHTVVTLTAERVPADERTEVIAGWVSVLMQLKAAVQFGVDLRNHDAAASWSAGYVEN